MEQDILIVEPGYKLYRDRAVFVGTFLGGPLVAGYMIGENFRHLGDRPKMWISWIIASIAMVAVIAAAIWIPGFEKIPRIAIPLVYSVIARVIMVQMQGEAIKAHIQNGGQLFSVWRAVGIGAMVAAIMLLIAFVLVYTVY